MALGKKSTAAKTAAPAAKKAAPAAPARKTVAAPAAPAAAEEAVVEVGSMIVFQGYAEGVPPEDQVLTEGETYEVVGISEPNGNEGDEGYDPGGSPIVSFANPNFNAKKKESESNPKTLEVEVFEGEYVLADAEDGEAEAEAEAEPAAKTTVKTNTAPAKTAPAKTATKPISAKASKAAEAAAESAADAAEGEGADEADDFPELENEDPEVLALVGESDDLIATAQSLESEAATKEFQLGGVLYHIRKDKKHLELEGGEAYADHAGFRDFLSDYFNIDYRKAMYLIEIYKHFTLAGIADAAAQVAAMGWTKASKIAKLVSAEGANSTELIELANTSSVKDLSEAIKDQVRVGADSREIVKRLTLKFRFAESEAKFIDETLKAAAEKLGLKNENEALAQIVTDWAQENGGATVKAAAKAAVPAKKAAPAKKATAKA